MRLHLWLRLVAALAMLLAVPVGAAAELKCRICGKRITGQYLKDDRGRVYCSQACFRRTLPTCAACGKRIEGRYLEAGGKRYCSRQCFRQSWPKCDLCGAPMEQYTRLHDHRYCPECMARPRCSECFLPYRDGHRYADGRVVCAACEKGLVDEAAARRLYVQAQDAIEALTGCTVRDAPKLDLVDLVKLSELWDRPLDPGLSIRGFYRHDRRWREFVDGEGDVHRPRNVTTGVYLLFPQRADNYRASAVHELMHHVQAGDWPKLQEAPLWVQEGICQYVAAMYCRRHRLARTLEVIEDSPDTVYGDGYRWFAATFGPNNWAAVRRWIEQAKVDELPAAAPPAK